MPAVDPSRAAQLVRVCVENGFRLAGEEVRRRLRDRALRKHLPAGWSSAAARPAQRAHARLALAEDTFALAATTDDEVERERLRGLAAEDLHAARDALTEVSGGTAMRAASDRIRRAVDAASSAPDPGTAALRAETARAQTAQLVVIDCAEDLGVNAAPPEDPAAQAYREWIDWVTTTSPSPDQAIAKLRTLTEAAHARGASQHDG